MGEYDINDVIILKYVFFYIMSMWCLMHNLNYIGIWGKYQFVKSVFNKNLLYEKRLLNVITDVKWEFTTHNKIFYIEFIIIMKSPNELVTNVIEYPNLTYNNISNRFESSKIYLGNT